MAQTLHRKRGTWARMVTLAAVLAGGLAGGAAVHATAQDDPTAQERALRARLEASPGDAGLECQLGWALVAQDRFGEAREVLDRAVERLGDPRPARERRRLAACLYNRGRALEGLARPDEARRDYERSLALRPSDVVRARRDALPAPASPPSQSVAPPDLAARQRAALAEIALRACRAEGQGRCAEATSVETIGAGACLFAEGWWLVQLGVDRPSYWVIGQPFGEPYGVRRLAASGMPGVAELEPVPVRIDAERCGVRVDTRIDVSNPDADYHHDYVDILWLEGGGVVRGLGLHTGQLETMAESGRERGWSVTLRLDGQGYVTGARIHGEPPADVARWVGRHPLSSAPR